MQIMIRFQAIVINFLAQVHQEYLEIVQPKQQISIKSKTNQAPIQMKAIVIKGTKNYT